MEEDPKEVMIKVWPKHFDVTDEDGAEVVQRNWDGQILDFDEDFRAPSAYYPGEPDLHVVDAEQLRRITVAGNPLVTDYTGEWFQSKMLISLLLLVFPCAVKLIGEAEVFGAEGVPERHLLFHGGLTHVASLPISD